MKNVYEVLRQRELEILQLEKEVGALRVIAPLLAEDKQDEATVTAASAPAGIPIQRFAAPASAPGATQARPTGPEGSAQRWP
jgi:hypothetical protein